MSDIITNDITNIIGYDLMDIELKNKLSMNPSLSKELENWTKTYIQNRHAFGIKECNVEYIDYDNLDIEELDEVEQKELMKKIKKNERLCPNHKTCILYKNNALVNGSKCMLEVADATTIREALYKELDVKPEDSNDLISIDKLVAVNVIGNRALRGLSAEALIDVVPTYSKGGVKYETKVNDNFAVYEKTQTLSEKLQKSLILNREDKAKYKKLVEGKTKEEVKVNVKNLIDRTESEFEITDVLEIVNSDKTNVKKPDQKKEEIEIIDIEG